MGGKARMIYVVNDLHGAKNLVAKTVDAIDGMKDGDILVINGDGAGARGPIMNSIVKIFYEVVRGESDVEQLNDAIAGIIGEFPEIPEEWIFKSVHAGVFRKLVADKYPAFAKCMREELAAVITDTLQPISEAAKAKGVKVIYAPGNGETVPDDFIVDDITVEHAVAPEERYYSKLAKEGFFEKLGIEYVLYAKAISDDVVVLSSNLLDLPFSEMVKVLREQGLFATECETEFSTVIAHYPPVIAPIGKAFSFWEPNWTDAQRIKALDHVLFFLSTTDPFVKVYFGHIHLGPKDPRMDNYPSSMGFALPVGLQATWVKPGTVLEI